MVARELARAEAELPAFISVGSPKYGGYGPGHLGPKFSPIRVDNPTAGLQDITPPVSRAEFTARTNLVEQMNAGFLADHQSRAAHAHQVTFGQAARLMHSPKTKAFDVSAEKPETRAQYGPGQFGQSVLLARRLVESG